MAGLLDQYNPQIDGLGLGLLGASQALLTPRRQGGGVGAAFGAFGGGLLQGEQMQRARMQDARREDALRQQMDMQRERFGMEKQQYADQQAVTRQQMERMQGVRNALAEKRPDLLPLFDADPKAAMARMFPDEPKPYNLRAGERRFDPVTNAPIAENPREATPPAPTELEKLQGLRATLPPGDPRIGEINERIKTLNYRQPPASMSVSYGAPFEGVDPVTGKVGLYQPGNRGGPPLSTGLGAPPKSADKPSGEERTAAGYVSRMLAAEQNIGAYEKTGRPTLGREALANAPLIGGVAGPYVRTDNQQLYRQAQEEWVRAKLRKESGAVIAADEMDREIATYFPKPGEPDSLVAQKAESRKQAIAALQTSAGRAETPVLPTAPKSAAKGGTTFDTLPPAQQFKGKTIRNDATGELMRSNGMTWQKVEQ